MFRDGAEPQIDPEDRAFIAEAMALLPEGPHDNETWGKWTAEVREATGRKGKGLFMPLRKALTGQAHGPDMAKVLPLLQVIRARADPARPRAGAAFAVQRSADIGMSRAARTSMSSRRPGEARICSSAPPVERVAQAQRHLDLSRAIARDPGKGILDHRAARGVVQKDPREKRHVLLRLRSAPSRAAAFPAGRSRRWPCPDR